MKTPSQVRAAGFTLVEIAIVLVIIGLLLGGVLKGQELIENSRIKSIANDMKAVQAAYNGYLDRYKAIPGDEDSATTMANRGWGASAAAGGGDADGVLLIPVANTFDNGGEQRAFWRALRASGLLAGDPAGAAGAAGLPRHAGGGLLGVAADASVYGQPGLSVCASGLTPKQAAGIDTLLDGALPVSQIGNDLGAVRASASAVLNPLPPTAAVAAGAAYDETAATSWTACMKI